MRIACTSSPLQVIKPSDVAEFSSPITQKPWKQCSELVTNFSDSARTNVTEELSLSSCEGEEPSYPCSSPPSIPELNKSRVSSKGPVGIIVSTPIRSVLPKRTIKKRVRFGGHRVVSTHTPASDMTIEELSLVHYQTKDYELFRGTAQFIAAEVRNRCRADQPPHSSGRKVGKSQRYDTVMETVYDACADRAARSKGIPLVPAPKHCLKPKLFKSLTHWIRAGHSRRGLEKFSLPYLITARPLARQAAKEAVLITQATLKGMDDDGGDSDKENVCWWWRSVFLPSKHQPQLQHCQQHERPLRGANGPLLNDALEPKRRHCRKELLERLGIPRHRITPSLSNGEVLQIVSEEYTRTSKLFAQAMGQGDAAAVGIALENT